MTIQAHILLALGFILAFGGVGGVELSENNPQLIVSTGIAVLGLLAMFAGTRLLNNDYQD